MPPLLTLPPQPPRNTTAVTEVEDRVESASSANRLCRATAAPKHQPSGYTSMRDEHTRHVSEACVRDEHRQAVDPMLHLSCSAVRYSEPCRICSTVFIDAVCDTFCSLSCTGRSSSASSGSTCASSCRFSFPACACVAAAARFCDSAVSGLRQPLLQLREGKVQL